MQRLEVSGEVRLRTQSRGGYLDARDSKALKDGQKSVIKSGIVSTLYHK